MGDDRMRQTEAGILDCCRINSGRYARPGLIEGLRQTLMASGVNGAAANSFRASMSSPCPPDHYGTVADGWTVMFRTVAETVGRAVCTFATAL